MKLLRYGPKGHEKPGLLADDGTIRDLSSIVSDINGEMLGSQSLKHISRLDVTGLPQVRPERHGPCVAAPGKLVCVGLNYTDHAQETGQPIPKEPVLFLKATSAISGPNDDIIIPKGSVKTDWEVELAVVIGTKASYISAHDALEYVAGYCIVNDVSEREYQFERGGNWSKGKSADTFAPTGPYLVTKDEIPDPQALALYCDLNGERMQNGTTANMIFTVAQLVSYISHFMTLHPGDIIPTGTPPGVGYGRRPQRFLKPDDILTLGVEGLGEQRQRLAAYNG